MAGDRQREENRVAWEAWLQQLDRRRARAREMGGPERVERLMHARGKLDARQRIERLFDPGTFVELGQLVGTIDDLPGDGYVCGLGRIHGRPALGGAEDFSLLGGSIGTGGTAKRHRIAELALQERVPLVVMLEGAGHRLTNTDHARAPHDLLALADLSGQVPTVCLVLGAAAGHSALAAPLSDFVVMSEAGCMFSGGPPLVKAATGEEVTKEALGGPEVCAEIAGTAHNVAPDDAAAIDLAREYLSYFPPSSGRPLPRRDGPDTGPRLVDEMLEIVPPNDRKPYDMHEVLACIADEGRVFEVQPRYGRSIITALAHVGGRAVAFVANDPKQLAGAIDSAAAIKATDFLEVVGPFRHPVVFLTDNPGVLAGSRAEREGILKWGGRMFEAERRLRAPKINVLMRKGFGFGLVNMGATPFDHQTFTYALPSVNLAAMPAASGGRSAGLDDDAQRQVEEAQRAGPYALANRLGVDEVIDPRELRNAILNALVLAEDRER
ncbi:MAG: carboxyl transferase domain-containing protein [Myxococcota bacterium]|nr:carboxyl transferase domain-containing protein [Myxococcota bacterium]